MNRKQNRLLFILFFTLLMCMNLAKAWHIAGECRFNASEESVLLKYVDDFSGISKICSENSRASTNCLFTWRLDNKGLTTNLVGGGRYLKASKEYIGSYHVSAKDMKESDVSYNWQLNDAGMLENFWAIVLRTTNPDGKKSVLSGDPYWNDWRVFEITRPKDNGKNKSVQSAEGWSITLRRRNFRNNVNDTTGFTEEINISPKLCKESIVHMEDSDLDLFDAGSPVYGISFTVKKKGGTASKEKSLLWGRKDGQFVVKPNSMDELVKPDYFAGSLGDEGKYNFQFTENGSHIKVFVGERLDADSNPVVTIEYPGSTIQDIAWVVPVKKHDEESKTDQKIFYDRDMQYIYQTTFTLSRNDSRITLGGLIGNVDTQRRSIFWGFTKSGEFVIQPDFFDGKMWISVDKWSKGVFEYIDRGKLSSNPTTNTLEFKSLGDGGKGVEYHIRVTVEKDAQGKFMPNATTVEYLKFKDNKSDTTWVKVGDISTKVLSYDRILDNKKTSDLD